ncbi:hypothetical protein KV580_22135 [Pseudomonas chlororaphis]|nr:hypothetical protein [Pseudomonas chlororaphis]
MSKLSKFKYNITVPEAAKLLTRLIDEDVSEDDIENLLSAHWIDGYFLCRCTIVKADFFLGDEQHEKNTDLGIYAVQTSEDVGICFTLPYPCGSVFIDGVVSAYALTDKEKSIYVLRDIETGQYLSRDSDSVFFNSLLIEVDSIYKLAKIANINEPAPESDIEIRHNRGCEGDKKYYPFFPQGWQEMPAQQTISTQANLETPSSALTIASLLEIVLDNKCRNLNQSSLILEVMERNAGIRGLSESGLQKIFAKANTLLTTARETAKAG